MLKYFPFSKQAKTDVMHCLVVVIGYCFVAWVAGFLGDLLSILPLINIVVGLAVVLIRLYCTVGAIVAILAFLNIVK